MRCCNGGLGYYGDVMRGYGYDTRCYDEVAECYSDMMRFYGDAMRCYGDYMRYYGDVMRYHSDVLASEARNYIPAWPWLINYIVNYYSEFGFQLWALRKYRRSNPCARLQIYRLRVQTVTTKIVCDAKEQDENFRQVCIHTSSNFNSGFMCIWRRKSITSCSIARASGKMFKSASVASAIHHAKNTDVQVLPMERSHDSLTLWHVELYANVRCVQPPLVVNFVTCNTIMVSSVNPLLLLHRALQQLRTSLFHGLPCSRTL